MSAIDSVTLEVDDLTAAEEFYSALGVGDCVRVSAADAPSDGFRSYTLSLVTSQPGNADLFFHAAIAAGATELKPLNKSLWGYGGVFRAPDGAIWKVASSKKKDSGPPAQIFDDLVLLLGVADVKATKGFYVEHGLKVDKAYGSKYVQFDSPEAPVKLGLYGHEALAKDAGVPPQGTGSHRILIHGDAGAFSDPDGFVWQLVPARA